MQFLHRKGTVFAVYTASFPIVILQLIQKVVIKFIIAEAAASAASAASAAAEAAASAASAASAAAEAAKN